MSDWVSKDYLPENQEQTMERLVLEFRQTMEALPSVKEEPFVEFIQGSVRGDTVFALMRVFDEARWMELLELLLEMDSGYGMNFKVSKRYIKKNHKLGFLWEVTVQGSNLVTAMYAFRSVVLGCVHELWVTGNALTPTLPIQERVRLVAKHLKSVQPGKPVDKEEPEPEEVEPGDESEVAHPEGHGLNEPVAVRRSDRGRAARFRVPNTPKTGEESRGKLPEGAVDGAYKVNLPMAQPDAWNERVKPLTTGTQR